MKLTLRLQKIWGKSEVCQHKVFESAIHIFAISVSLTSVSVITVIDRTWSFVSHRIEEEEDAFFCIAFIDSIFFPKALCFVDSKNYKLYFSTFTAMPWVTKFSSLFFTVETVNSCANISLRSASGWRQETTVTPRNTGCQGTSKFHLLLADFR